VAPIPSLPAAEHPVGWNKVPAAVFDATKLINERAGRMFPGELEWVRFSLTVPYGFAWSIRVSIGSCSCFPHKPRTPGRGPVLAVDIAC
jgi:hypothetical protein